MKSMKKILSAIVGLILSGSVLFAQVVEVTPGSTRTFTVNLLNGVTLHPTTPYTWTWSGAGIVSATPTNNTLSATFSNTVNSTANIQVYATSADNCRSDIKQINLTVKPLTFNATFAQAAQDVCPITTGNPTGGDAAGVQINFTGGTVNSFVYVLDGTSYTVNLPVPGTSYTLDVATAYTNSEAGVHTIEIVSITGGSVTSLLPNGSVVHTINVRTAPVISDIF